MQHFPDNLFSAKLGWHLEKKTTLFSATLLWHMHTDTGRTFLEGCMTHATATVNYLWGVNRYGSVRVRPCNGQNWVHVDGTLKQMDADDHKVWCLLYLQTPSRWQWKLDSCYWTLKACFCQWKWLHLGSEYQ